MATQHRRLKEFDLVNESDSIYLKGVALFYCQRCEPCQASPHPPQLRWSSHIHFPQWSCCTEPSEQQSEVLRSHFLSPSTQLSLNASTLQMGASRGGKHTDYYTAFRKLAIHCQEALHNYFMCSLRHAPSRQLNLSQGLGYRKGDGSCQTKHGIRNTWTHYQDTEWPPTKV